ncbi:MAG TPA: hypothetical protein VI299_29185 [Polyangiales bacterium]
MRIHWAWLLLVPSSALAEASLFIERPCETAQPLDRIDVVSSEPGTLSVLDGEGHEYARMPIEARASFEVGGALGTHSLRLQGPDGALRSERKLEVDASTRLEENSGTYSTLFTQAVDTMTVKRPGGDDGAPAGGHDTRHWRGRDYRLYVGWMLDHAQTSKGMAYVSPHIRDGVLLFRDAQKSDGMIWSFVRPDEPKGGYYDTAYGALGMSWHDGGLLWARQPVANHDEYEFVNALFTAWQASGDDAFMAASLPAAMRALDYGVSSEIRYSQKFGLLKRPYTIDSWDFQVDDPYLVKNGLSPVMTLDPKQTKFGIFFGDNTGYIHACRRLATMLAHAHRQDEAARYEKRADELEQRLRTTSWNGRFFRHYRDEDESVKRNLGVDEASQLAQANMYSLNRGIPHDQARSILSTYRALRRELPPGSPGEWYAIYPPFERGFGSQGETWQYMNGGIAGHAASELARGAFEHGFEHYGVETLQRLAALIARTDGKVHFAYTGAYIPPKRGQSFTALDLRTLANMDIKAPSWGRAWMDGNHGNDLGALPIGKLTAGGAPFQIIDPRTNQRRAAIGIARKPGWPERVEIPTSDQQVGAVYLLHTAQFPPPPEGPPRSDPVNAAALTFIYSDDTQRGVYLQKGVHITGWWYPDLKTAESGVAWRGPNQKTGDVGVTWSVLANPEPEKTVRALELSASASGGAYALLAVTLADRMPYRPRELISYGGPDNWAGSNMVVALLEGLAGVHDDDRAFRLATLSPRWSATWSDRATVIARYGASRGYVGYRFAHDRRTRAIALKVTGASQKITLRVLLPEGQTLEDAALDGRPLHGETAQIESSTYAVFELPGGLHDVQLHYRRAR